MSLAPGTRLGPYEIVAPLGAGGMGEVFRARDTKLGREVALKILPASFADDPDPSAGSGSPRAGERGERRARFEREARTLAALNHPHIAQVYGFEESVPQAGAGTPGPGAPGVPARPVCALVMELVPGESLAARLARGVEGRGPVPLREALDIARQVADGLEAAHEKGIVHRDLKPGNVQVTPEGVAKVLDFGLAKPRGSAAGAGPDDDAATITSPAQLTQHGLVLGTAAYMSPEQARGQAVDARTDVWAFGALLYELLSGTRAFPGPAITDTLAQVLERDPDWAALPATTPSSIRGLVQRCLRKDPRQRLHDIADARFAIEDALAALSATSSGLGVETSGAGAIAAQPTRAIWRHPLPLAFALVTLAIGGALGWWRGRTPEPSTGAVVRLTMPVQPLAVLNHAAGPAVAISPDGSRVAYVAGDKAIGQLYVRRLDMAEAEPVKGASEALSPFWSPDGVWLAYVNAGKLTKLRIADGQTVVLADTPGIHGGTMSAGGTIVVGGGRDLQWGISRVPPEGGSPDVLVAPDPARSEVYLCWPTFLPDGKTVLYTVVSGNGVGFEVVALSLADKSRRVVMTGPLGNVRYVAPGFLVFQQAGTLSAVRFDMASLTVSGSPSRMVLDPLWLLPQENVLSHFDIAPSGTLVYLPNGGRQPRQRLVWVDRAGREEPLPDLVAQMGADTVSDTFLPRISPDGQRLALVHMNLVSSKGRLPERDVWVYDFARGTVGRLPSRTMPLWMPDGERIASGAVQDSAYGNGLVIERADGAGAPAEILPFQGGREPVPGAVSRDGRYLLYTLIQPPGQVDIHRMDLDRRTSEVLIGGPGLQSQPALSPDERWLAYASNETGREEVYLTDYPARQRRWQLTSNGGSAPAWGSDGREVFFVSRAESGGLWRVRLGSGAVPAPGEPSVMFNGPYARGSSYGRAYEVSHDGRRFLMNRRADFGPVRGQLSVVLNWTSELRERLPR